MLEYKKAGIITKVKNRLKVVLNILKGDRFVRPYIGITKYDVIIYDDVFPSERSLFRFTEFSHYIACFNKIKFLSTGTALKILNEKKSFNELKKDYLSDNREVKINAFEGFINLNTKLLYCVFLSNAFRIIDYVDYYRLPFIFTLYPGGGFRLNNESSDKKLQRVLTSPNLKKVIVTQKITYQYLLDKNLCSEDKIHYIFGVVSDVESKVIRNSKRRWKIEKETFDICFVAAKYTPLGIDKGYDTFIAVVKELSKQYDELRIHIVGGFDRNDIDVSDLGNKIFFYGFQNVTFLNSFFQDIDLILSPNIPFQIDKGSFDGFPLGTCIEASLNGVAMMVCDELGQNDGYIDGEEIIIIKPDVLSIVKKIEYWIDNYSKLLEISERGKNKTLKLYSSNIQLNKRTSVLKEFL